jgi:hypothetical protein
MAKLKKRREEKPDKLPMKNMERHPHRREVTTILFGPNRVANIPPIREKRRYPSIMAPLKSPISL